MALILPLSGTETSVCRCVGRPRYQALAIAPSSRNDHGSVIQGRVSIENFWTAQSSPTTPFTPFLCSAMRAFPCENPGSPSLIGSFNTYVVYDSLGSWRDELAASETGPQHLSEQNSLVSSKAS